MCYCVGNMDKRTKQWLWWSRCLQTWNSSSIAALQPACQKAWSCCLPAKCQCLTQESEPVSSLTFESTGSRALNPSAGSAWDDEKTCAGGLNLSHAFSALSLELIHFFFLPLQGVSFSPIVRHYRKGTWLIAFLFLTVQANYIKFLGIIKRKYISLW